jgi:hypothetical protein
MSAFFGKRAERLRGALPPGVEALVFDEDRVAEAAREAVRRRERGERFYGLALLDEPRVRACNSVAVALNASLHDAGQRQAAFAALAQGVLGVNGGPVSQLWDAARAAHSLTTVNYALSLCDEVLVRSFLEYRRYTQLRHFNGRGFRRLLLAATLPEVEPAGAAGETVLVWTGRRDPADATIALAGLDAWTGGVAYAGDVPVPNVRARFLGRDEGAVRAALAASSCVVCVDPADPADAVALARRGVPVVATLTSGAYEFSEAVVSWDAADAGSLPGAVAAALASARAA